ncbi:MAG: hypothetical protein FWD32_02275 [Firmicutes bacterium]|nr:hypothetical protein [Bacillota bacterium]
MAQVLYASSKLQGAMAKHNDIAIKPAIVPTHILPNGSNYQFRGHIVFGLEEDERFTFKDKKDLVALVPALGDVMIENVQMVQPPYINYNNSFYIETNRVGSRGNTYTSTKSMTWVSALDFPKLITMPKHEFDILVKSGELCYGNLPTLQYYIDNKKQKSFNEEGKRNLQLIGAKKVKETLEFMEKLETQDKTTEEITKQEFMKTYNCNEKGYEEFTQNILAQSVMHKTLKKYIVEEKLHDRINNSNTTTQITSVEVAKNNNPSGT